MNSSADIKAFTGRHGGTICPSSNAKRALTWALGERASGGRGGEKVLFLPDQHLGRNTAVLELGLRLDDCVVWDPRRPYGGLEPDELRRATIILWKGHCSVHGRFRAANVVDVRRRIPGVNVIAHPECVHDVVLAADYIASTEHTNPT